MAPHGGCTPVPDKELRRLPPKKANKFHFLIISYSFAGRIPMIRNISHISEGSRDAPTLLWAIQPLIWPLQIFGYFAGFSKRRYSFIYKCYSVSVIITSTLHAVRYAFLYNSKDDILSAETMFKVVVNAWSWQAAGATLILCYGH